MLISMYCDGNDWPRKSRFVVKRVSKLIVNHQAVTLC